MDTILSDPQNQNLRAFEIINIITNEKNEKLNQVYCMEICDKLKAN